MKDHPATTYRQKREKYQKQKTALRIKLIWVSVARLLAFAFLFFTVYESIREPRFLWISLIFVSFTIFLLLVNYYYGLKDIRGFTDQLVFINENELEVLNGAENQFPDGLEFKSGSLYDQDLDIFGPRSLYHLLNRTTTIHGSKRLAAWLAKPEISIELIGQKQEAVRTISEQVDKRQKILAHGLWNREIEGNFSEVLQWINLSEKLDQNKALLFIRWALPAMNLFLVFYYLCTENYLPLIGGIILSWLITGIYAKYINKQHRLIGQKQKILNQYVHILKEFSGVDSGSSDLLDSLKETAGFAHLNVQRLSRLSGWFDQRLNMVVYVLLNSLFLYDIQITLALEGWKERNRRDFEKYMDCTADIEAWSSLGTFAYNHSGFAIPKLQEGPLFIEAKNLFHPLIPEKESVGNDFRIGREDRLQILTGSNMSGKTTFLRTIGCNIIMAQCGLPVCAEYFNYTPLYVLSSIRVDDSLQEHTSYFMAELKKLQMIIHFLESGKPALVLVDEILKGTNSEDKTQGSEAFIKRLVQKHCLTIFATHDLVLSGLSDKLPGQVSNYCFESRIENDELHFDYVLQQGVAKNRNASFLMKKMQII